MTNRSLNAPLFAALLALALVTAGCSSVNLQSHTATSPEEALQVAAGQGNRESAESYLLRTARQFQSQGSHEAARRILTSDQLKSPAPANRNEALLLAMSGAAALADEQWAQSLGQQLTIDQFRNYPPDTLARAGNLQTETFRLGGQPFKAAETLMLLRDSDPNADIQSIHDRIWQLLKDASDQQLEAAAREAVGFESQGWLELASVMRTPGAGIEEQGNALKGWQAHWPGHAASATLPGELKLIASIATSRPDSINLAVPLSGPLAAAGQAIRDGFLAAFYTDESTANQDIEISITDTHGKSFAELYQTLAAKGPDLIVGPLEKEGVGQLAAMENLPVPVLALNYLPDDTTTPAGLYQFGLSAEDEARQIADRLTARNSSQVLALIPAGEWGDRLERALTSQLAENGGVALDIERFFPEDNFRAVTAELLAVNSSRDRAVDVERTAGVNVEFEPRRRQDVDAIVLVAAPLQARQFKPLFAFYFAGDVPVYSPSVVFDGTADPSRDRDLDSVIVTDIPWVLKPDNDFRDTATARLPGYQGQLGRLFAMGADAYQLSSSLPLLEQIEGTSIAGQTGELNMSPGGIIHRRQLWAQFRNGRPALIEEDEQEPEAAPPSAITSE